MIAFRVTKQSLKLGDEIAPGHQLSDLPEDRHKVELMLEALRPQLKPKRTNARYVFKSLDSALMWAKEVVGRRVFVVEVEDVLHQGDWAWVGQIWKERDEEICKTFAAKYWSSEMTENPTIELIVSKAKVIAEDNTITTAEQRESRRVKYGMPDPASIFINRTK